MALTNYSELQTHVLARASRADLSAEFADFVRLAEQVIYFGIEHDSIEPLRVKEMEAETTVSITTGTGSLPADFLTARALSLQNAEQYLDYLSPYQFRAQKGLFTGSSKPGYFTIESGALDVLPAWTGTLDLAYIQRPAALTTGAPINTIMTDYPDVYVYGAMRELAKWIRDDEALAFATVDLRTAINNANSMSSMGKHSGATLKLRTRRIKANFAA